jgi:hypothetical protein
LHDVFKFYSILDYDRKVKELHGENDNENDNDMFTPIKRAKKSKKKLNMKQKKLRSCHIISS